MTTVFQKICEMVGMSVSGSDLARKAVVELLPCVGLKEKDCFVSPKFVADEITSYLDDLVKNP